MSVPLACVEPEALLLQIGQSAIGSDDFFARAKNRAEQLLLLSQHECAAPEPLLTQFLQEYSLSSSEGIALMSLAEALLRIPNSRTAGRLIRDKLIGMDWAAHRGTSDSLWVNASTWGLLLSGKYLAVGASVAEARIAKKAVALSLEKKMRQWGEPVIRAALSQALLLMGHKFVLAESIENALEKAQSHQLYSFDMLGEAAVNAADAECYYQDYRHAIEALGQYKPCSLLNRSAIIADSPHAYHSVSIKLSALHPRFEISQLTRLQNELFPKVKALALAAKRSGIGLTLDAETCASTEITLAVLTYLSRDKDLSDWQGLGICIQAYQTRAQALLSRCIELAKRCGRTLSVRLVKGAYWDSEVKWAQQLGLVSYPVFTRKAHTDCSYLLCTEQLLQASLKTSGLIYPQFASHNALTLSAVLTRAKELGVDSSAFECQRLFGMGQALHEAMSQSDSPRVQSRVYAPVGPHKTLLAYLVRRMLENGANSSFVNQLYNPKVDIEKLLLNPVVAAKNTSPNTLPRPQDIYQPDRNNSVGENLWLHSERDQWQLFLQHEPLWSPKNSVKSALKNTLRDAVNPASHCVIGQLSMHSDNDLENFVDLLSQNLTVCISDRIDKVMRLAELMATHNNSLALLCVRECGKTLPDALDDIREAIDFCYYYAAQAKRLEDEKNQRESLEPAGLVICISPWNFPVAIFTGQVCAALLAGNNVLVKPASSASLTASFLWSLFRGAGFSEHECQLAICSPKPVQKLLCDPRVGGVLFTGSENSAEMIRKNLLKNKSALPVFVAETGGQNSMIVDSSALLEQVVGDIIRSSFNSAGQRCSALRVLYIQNDIFDETLEKLTGAMAELCIGDPSDLRVDIGPVIDPWALQLLQQHCQWLDQQTEQAKLIYRCDLPSDLAEGYYFAPCIYEINDQSLLRGEVFGPVLHVIRYNEFELSNVIAAINASGYGLTLGVHSRIESTQDFICARARVGNIYINRNQVGAVVGAQPFGGMGRSGTGPKAGGPNYLPALQHSVEKCVAAPSILNSVVIARGIESKNTDNELSPSASILFEPAVIGARLEALDNFLLMLHNDVFSLARDNRSGALFLHRVSELQQQALAQLLESTVLPAVAGEHNQLRLLPRGHLLLICRDSLLVAEWWLQLLAALVAGNRVDLWVQKLSFAAVNSGLKLLQKAGFSADSWRLYELDDSALAIVSIDSGTCLAGVIDHPESTMHVQLALALLEFSPAVPVLAEPFSKHYLSHFCVEQVISTDTSAFGGNIELLNT